MEEGHLVAEEGLIPVDPWVLRESTRHPGRFYFFNPESRKSTWTLPQEMIRTQHVEHLTRLEDQLAAAFDQAQRVQDSYYTVQGVPASSQASIVSSGRTGSMHTHGSSRAAESSRLDAQHRSSTKLRISTSWRLGSFQAPQSGPDQQDFPYTIVNGLGQGGYSSVLLVRHVGSAQFRAMKVIPKRRLNDQRDRVRIKNELRALTELPPSPFLLRCEAAYESSSSIFLITEYNSGGDLFFHLSKRINQGHSGFTEDQARVLLAEITLALEHMHTNRFIHRDIKVENIMLDPEGHVKLVDFGLSREISQEVEPLSPTGSLAYMTPELLIQHNGGRHTDWWAMGVVAYELMTGRSPWSSSTDTRVIRREIKAMKVVIPKSLSPLATAFIRSLMQPDYTKRLGTVSSAEVRQSPFFEGIDWDATERREVPPPIVLPKNSFMKTDCTSAIETYLKKNDGDAGWTFGLPMISHNPCLPTSSHQDKRPSVRLHRTSGSRSSVVEVDANSAAGHNRTPSASRHRHSESSASPSRRQSAKNLARASRGRSPGSPNLSSSSLPSPTAVIKRRIRASSVGTRLSSSRPMM